MVCSCEKEDFGTVYNKIPVKIPKHWVTSRRSRYVYIDKCMVKEIKILWKHYVRTIECCCGHGVVSGYIIVDAESQNIMIDLGYINGPKKGRLDMFIPNGEG